jgi:uncharacterized membrane protein
MKYGKGAALLSAVIALFVISSASAPAGASQMKHDSNVAAQFGHGGGATVEQQKIGNKNFQVAQVLIHSKPEIVWDALTSYNRADEIYSNLKRLQILHDNGDKKTISFTVASMGGLWKYDYVLNIAELKAEKRIEWTRHSGAFKENEGFWQLTPVDGDKTLVTYAKHIDGGMLLPQAMVNGELRKIMPEVLNNLRTAVAKERIAINAK